jgi:hypothetical protein
MILNYKLFEDVNRSKKILKDLGIPEDIENKDYQAYKKLRELLKNNNGYVGAFTKWMFKDREKFEQIEEVYKMLTEIQIDRHIDSFEKLEDLYDYLQNFEINQKTNQVIKALPSRTRQLVNNELKNLISLNTEYSKSVKDFYSKKGGRYKDIQSLINDTKDYINNLKGDFNLESIKKKLEGLNVIITAESEELLLIQVLDYDASCKIGSKSWCIVTSESYWRNYVNEFTNQYFVYDFTKDISDKRHMIGFTVSPGDKISNAHWADDSSVRNPDQVIDEL